MDNVGVGYVGRETAVNSFMGFNTNHEKKRGITREKIYFRKDYDSLSIVIAECSDKSLTLSVIAKLSKVLDWWVVFVLDDCQDQFFREDYAKYMGLVAAHNKRIVELRGGGGR